MKESPFENDNNGNDQNFKTILDGTCLHGWKMCGPGRFDLIDNMIISSGGQGGFLDKREKHLALYFGVEWEKSKKKDNFGVVVRFYDRGGISWIGVYNGY